MWGRLAVPALSALSTNETGLILLGRKAMTIEAFDGLLLLPATLVLLLLQLEAVFVSPAGRYPSHILVPSKFALN